MNALFNLARELEEKLGEKMHTLSIDKREKGTTVKREWEESEKVESFGQEFYFEGNTMKAFICRENLSTFEHIPTNLFGDPKEMKRGRNGITYTRTI